MSSVSPLNVGWLALVKAAPPTCVHTPQFLRVPLLVPALMFPELQALAVLLLVVVSGVELISSIFRGCYELARSPRFDFIVSTEMYLALVIVLCCLLIPLGINGPHCRLLQLVLDLHSLDCHNGTLGLLPYRRCARTRDR